MRSENGPHTDMKPFRVMELSGFEGFEPLNSAVRRFRPLINEEIGTCIRTASRQTLSGIVWRSTLDY